MLIYLLVGGAIVLAVLGMLVTRYASEKDDPEIDDVRYDREWREKHLDDGSDVT